jgi:hypothetical protein
MYKDKSKQKEAVKEATRRWRAKGITKVSPKVKVEYVIPIIPKVTPRSIGLGVDSKESMIEKFLKGAK